MGRKRTDFVRDEIYSTHLYGDSNRFLRNPSVQRQAVIERMYMRILTELCANRFKWEGLPDEVDIRHLEMTLFYRALSIFFKDVDKRDAKGNLVYAGTDRYMSLRGSGNGQWNMMDNPTSFIVTAPTFSATLTADECVPIWANYSRIPDVDIVMIYAHRLAELDMTIEINTKSARRTKLLVANENQKLSAVNIARQIDEGVPVIQLTQSIDGMITAVDMGVNPDTIVELSILRARIWNECMGLLGINNANQDKKERLVANEVEANNEQVGASRSVGLNARRFAAAQINEKYGLSVSVDFTDELDAPDPGEDTGEGDGDARPMLRAGESE